MKWFFIILLSLNIILLGVQWLDHREDGLASEYLEVDEDKKIELLRERGQGIKQESTDARCALLGPIDEEAVASNLKKVLLNDSVSAELVVQEHKKAPGYWVYFDELNGDAARQSQLEEFRSKGVDSFVIAAGDLKGAISLGVFENIDSARRLKKKMIKRGYIVKISEIQKSETEYWLLLPIDYAAENKHKIDKIVSSVLKNQEMREIFCKSVASEKQFP